MASVPPKFPSPILLASLHWDQKVIGDFWTFILVLGKSLAKKSVTYTWAHFWCWTCYGRGSLSCNGTVPLGPWSLRGLNEFHYWFCFFVLADHLCCWRLAYSCSQPAWKERMTSYRDINQDSLEHYNWSHPARFPDLSLSSIKSDCSQNFWQCIEHLCGWARSEGLRPLHMSCLVPPLQQNNIVGTQIDCDGRRKVPCILELRCIALLKIINHFISHCTGSCGIQGWIVLYKLPSSAFMVQTSMANSTCWRAELMGLSDT